MRLLTGKDREAYEALLKSEANLQGQCGHLETRLGDAQEETQRLRGDCARERQRADAAVDELLSLRGIPPISPQLPMAPSGDFNPLAEDPEEAARIEKRMMEMGPAAVFAEVKA